MTTLRARALLAAALLGGAAVLAASAPAQAQLGGCGLTITAPGTAPSKPSAPLGSATVSVPLGQVQVCVSTSTLSTRTFTAKVSTDGFSTGGQTAQESIAPEAVAYTRGTLSLVPLSLSLSGCSVDTSAPVQLAATETAVLTCGVTGLLGDATVSWTPTLTIDVSGAQVAGDYSGTVTHSVA